jgi:hypothetical protein
MGSDSNAPRFPRPKKWAKILVRDGMISNHVANFGMSLLRLTGCGECGGDNDGDKSDSQCADRLAARSNRHMDFRRTDSSGRTGADSSRKDNN